MASTDDRIQFKWTVDRHNGYNRVTIFVNGRNMGSTAGGGYDMKGTVLSTFMKRRFPTDLKRLSGKNLYGLEFYDEVTGKYYDDWAKNRFVSLDGGKRFEEMVSVLNALGYNFRYEKETKSSSWYVMSKM